MNKEALDKDTEFYSHKIEAVTPEDVKPGEPEAWTIQIESGGMLRLQNVERVPTPPKAGEVARFYGKGFGYPVRGVAVEGRVYSYMTEEEQEAAHKQWVEEKKAERMLQFASERPKFEADVAALPAPFQARFAWFRRDPNWQHEFGPYELFACQEAVKVAAKLTTVDAIRDFANQPVAMQKRMVPDLAYDEHSGNTFGSALRIAAMYIANPELLPKFHGALCALVGCEGYGCWAASDEAKAERAKAEAEKGASGG